MPSAGKIRKNYCHYRIYDRCVLDIVTVTDFSSKSVTEKPQVYISGTLHGDEVIGPQAAYYLLEYLLSNYQVDPQVTHLL
jgi:predicted deacylase